MPRRSRRRLLPNRKKHSVPKPKPESEEEKGSEDEKEPTTPRGRLQGALKDALDPTGDDSDASDPLLTPMKRTTRLESKSASSSDEEERVGKKIRGRHQSPQRYILKLFDRSVDLSQFEEDSPLYPICRAWIANQPRMNYKKFGKRKFKAPKNTGNSVELPGPVGPPISRIPQLLPEQEERNKDNINLNYEEAPPPPREVLLAQLSERWVGVRQAWLDQAARVEARYDATQQLLNRINVNSL